MIDNIPVIYYDESAKIGIHYFLKCIIYNHPFTVPFGTLMYYIASCTFR